jgi:hypothetical protein
MFGTTDMNNFSFDGTVERNGESVPFFARVDAAKASATDPEEWSCLVHAPALLAEDKEIYGVDADQAHQLAIDFLKSMLSGLLLRDQAGKRVDLASWQ